MNDTVHPVLVVGDDGTPPSDWAWRWTTLHAWPGWNVEVMTADDSDVVWGEPCEATEWTPTWARTEEIEGARSVRFLTMATDPRAMMADRGDAELLVVGLRSHSYLEAVVTGSTTEWLLHHPPAPLVVVNEPETVHSVTVCVDGSLHSIAAVEAFAALPLASGTDVTVLSVDDDRADARAASSAAVAALTGRVADVKVALGEGEPTETILDHLDAHRPELVVLGTRGLTGWQRLRLGSTAAAVVRAAPCTSLVTADESALERARQ